MTTSIAPTADHLIAPHRAFGTNPARARRAKAPRGPFETVVAWQSRAAERSHLRQLDGRLLADMGMTRADAVRESRKPFWQV